MQMPNTLSLLGSRAGEDSALSVGEKEEESELEFGEELEEEELEEKPLGFEKELEEEELEESELEFGEEEEELQVEGVHDIVEVASPVKQPRLETIHVLSDDDDEEEEEENIEKGTDVVALEVSEDDDDQGVQPSEHQDQLQTVGKEPAAPLVYAIEEEDKPPTTTTTTTTHRITPPQQFVPPASFLAAQAAQAAASTTTPISQAISKLELAKQQLKLEHNRASRDADTVTPEMKHEVMAVLELFGLPYVQSPMEAEAQCAALELAGLVHGVVTEDSDVFLFGARHVYKNLFTTDTGKQISAYLAQDIAEQFSIHREQFISLALLLGSDYTEGVNGIGIVNALEVLSAFPNLEEFKLWMDSGELDDGEDDVTTQFKLSHANARRRWGLGLSPNFPSLQVREAYDHPAVLDNPGPFVFREPDLEAIRSLCVDKLRMPEDRVKKQVIEALVRPSAPTQTTLDGFVEIQGKQRFAAIQSKRMAKAVQGLKRAQYDDDEEEGGEQATILAVDNLGNVVPLNRKAKG
ncbi:hypothetical protein BASA81_008413 [Batrachochytrium salamandrivorans]|nr:hypothetical protein BASA81_008413 [Batrachochytrium salamandrivorans]